MKPIWIVDDDQSIRWVLEKALSRENFTTRSFSGVRDRLPGLPVIIMTAFSDLDSAVAAFQGGAFEYLSKPFDVDKAVELIRRAVDESMRGEAAHDERVTETPEMLGQAPAMQDMFRTIGRLSHRRRPCSPCSSRANQALERSLSRALCTDIARARTDLSSR